jgi:hypothetical protein
LTVAGLLEVFFVVRRFANQLTPRRFERTSTDGIGLAASITAGDHSKLIDAEDTVARMK